MSQRYPSTQGRDTMRESEDSGGMGLWKVVLSLLAFAVGIAAFFVIRNYLGRGGEPQESSTGRDLFRGSNEQTRSNDTPNRIKSAITSRLGNQSGPDATETSRDEHIDQASDLSFPASDPPSWTAGPSKAQQKLND